MEELNPNKQLTQDMSSSRPKSIRKKLAWFVGIILAILMIVGIGYFCFLLWLVSNLPSG